VGLRVLRVFAVFGASRSDASYRVRDQESPLLDGLGEAAPGLPGGDGSLQRDENPADVRVEEVMNASTARIFERTTLQRHRARAPLDPGSEDTAVISRRAFFVRLAGGAAVMLKTAPPPEPSCCVIVSRNDPRDYSRSERYEALRALARDMESRDEALVIEETPARRDNR
jgi:hypothetical protein